MTRIFQKVSPIHTDSFGWWSWAWLTLNPGGSWKATSCVIDSAVSSNDTKIVSWYRSRERQDNDDVACFDVDRGKVVIVHDFASPGYEQRADFADFYAWLRQAIEDLIAFD